MAAAFLGNKIGHVHGHFGVLAIVWLHSLRVPRARSVKASLTTRAHCLATLFLFITSDLWSVSHRRSLYLALKSL